MDPVIGVPPKAFVLEGATPTGFLQTDVTSKRRS
jgi:hypothetical protein